MIKPFKSLWKKIWSYGREIAFAGLLAALSFRVAHAESPKDVDILDMLNCNKQYTQVVDAEAEADGVVFMSVDKASPITVLKDIKENPKKYRFQAPKKDQIWIYNTVKAFAKAEGGSCYAFKIDARNGKVITVVDSDGNDLFDGIDDDFKEMMKYAKKNLHQTRTDESGHGVLIDGEMPKGKELPGYLDHIKDWYVVLNDGHSWPRGKPSFVVFMTEKLALAGAGHWRGKGFDGAKIVKLSEITK